MPRPVKLSVIVSDRKRENAKAVKRELYYRIGQIVNDCGDDIAGYAVVVWDKNGSNWSNLQGGAPIKTRMAPEFVRDALSQHVAIDMANQERNGK